MTSYLPHLACTDFSDDVWERLCIARIHYLLGSDKRAWYTALREHCGYKGGGTHLKTRMEEIVDEWLQQHPTWCARIGGIPLPTRRM